MEFEQHRIVDRRATAGCICAAGLAVLALLPAPGRANMGKPTRNGWLVAEPHGMIKDVEVTRETLMINLRPLAEAKGEKKSLAQIEAVYHLHNPGANEQSLDLMFAFGSSDSGEFRAWLDDENVACRRATKEVKLPENWKATRKEPHDRIASMSPGTPMLLTVVIPPGKHSLKVRYTVEAAYDLRGRPTVKRLFDYVLAPARSWAGFGGLEVTIQVPDDWHVTCEPSMKREGNTLKGTFAEIPADAIVLTLQAPAGPHYETVKITTLILLAVAVFGGFVVCVLCGWAKGRRMARPPVEEPDADETRAEPGFMQRHVWPLSLGMGVLWGAAILGTGLLAVFGPDWALPAHQTIDYGGAQAIASIGIILLSFLAVPVGFAATQLTAYFSRK